MSPREPETAPATEAGRRTVELLRQHWGEPYTTDTIRAIEQEAVRRHVLSHDGMSVATVYGYEAGLKEGRQEAAADSERRLRNAEARILVLLRQLDQVETEWYNGNVDEGARDRILAAAPQAAPPFAVGINDLCQPGAAPVRAEDGLDWGRLRKAIQGTGLFDDVKRDGFGFVAEIIAAAYARLAAPAPESSR